MRVLLVPNTANPAAVASTVELATWLAAQGLEPVLSVNDAKGSGLEGFAVLPSEIGTPLLTVALGGDGTLLKAVHLLGDVESPVLGVKFGRLGFLAGVTPEHVRAVVMDALAGEARIERRATLHVEVVMDGRVMGEYRALNEVTIVRSGDARVIALDVDICGHHVARLRADGLVISTATGSTAYAMSAGGPLVAPGFRGMIVVPIAPHTLSVRPLVTDPSDVVEITFPDPTRADARVVVDGEAMPRRRSLERVVVKRGDHDVLMVRSADRAFYDTVAEEFFGG